MYRRFVLPYEQELTRAIQRMGGLSILHICGNTTAMLAEIARCGADGCDVDSPTDWAAAVATLGPRMCVKGNINPLLLLSENVHRLVAACETAKQVARDAAGFILSTGCLVPRDATANAFEIMACACGLRPAQCGNLGWASPTTRRWAMPTLQVSEEET
jgi:uroporphyrinogen-III decarboxylase